MTIDLGLWHFTLHPWDLLGFLGQAMFFSRFLVQWLASERAGRSYVPTAFWWLSLTGGSLSLVYAIGIHNPVFTLGQSVGLVPYVRNMVLVRRQQRHESSVSAERMSSGSGGPHSSRGGLK